MESLHGQNKEMKEQIEGVQTKLEAKIERILQVVTKSD